MKIIPYIPQHFNDIASFMRSLQEYLVSIDPEKSLKSIPGGNIAYTNYLLERIQDSGVIFLAQEDEKILGVIAGKITEQTAIEKLGDREKKIGTILELVVTEESRGSGVGTQLMETLEAYFIEQGCNWLTVECFVPNTDAHNFYEKLGYRDRSVYMTKTLN